MDGPDRQVAAEPLRRSGQTYDAVVCPDRTFVVDSTRDVPMHDVLRHLDLQNAVFRERRAGSGTRTEATGVAGALGRGEIAP